MTIIAANEINASLEKMASLSDSDRIDVLIHGILMAICYTPLKCGLCYDQRTKSAPEGEPEYWEKKHTWLNHLVPAFLNAAYSGDPKHLKETGWVGLLRG